MRPPISIFDQIIHTLLYRLNLIRIHQFLNLLFFVAKSDQSFNNKTSLKISLLRGIKGSSIFIWPIDKHLLWVKFLNNTIISLINIIYHIFLLSKRFSDEVIMALHLLKLSIVFLIILQGRDFISVFTFL